MQIILFPPVNSRYFPACRHTLVFFLQLFSLGFKAVFVLQPHIHTQFKSAGSCKTDSSPLSRVRHHNSLFAPSQAALRGMSTADKNHRSHQNMPPPPGLTLTLFALSQGDGGGPRSAPVPLLTGIQGGDLLLYGPADVKRTEKVSQDVNRVHTQSDCSAMRLRYDVFSSLRHEVREERNQRTLFGPHF